MNKQTVFAECPKEFIFGTRKPMTPQEACRKIVENAEERSLNWAVNYAMSGAGLPNGPELKVQCLYVLSNISRWRGPLAKEVRETLKAYAGVK